MLTDDDNSDATNDTFYLEGTINEGRLLENILVDKRWT